MNTLIRVFYLVQREFLQHDVGARGVRGAAKAYVCKYHRSQRAPQTDRPHSADHYGGSVTLFFRSAYIRGYTKLRLGDTPQKLRFRMSK